MTAHPLSEGARAVDLHHEAVVVDCHNDLILTIDLKAGVGEPRYFEEFWLPCLRQGGVDVQVLPVYSEDQPLGSGLRRVLTLIEWVYELVGRNPDDVALCMTGADIDAATRAGKVAFVISMEGCGSLGQDFILMRTMFRLGVRMASFTHFGRTMFGDGSVEDAAGGRLTNAGVAALQEMEQLGIVMDVSHLGLAGVDHVLEIATRPIVASHSSARALCDHHRNLSDEHLRGIAATGGVVGVNFITGFIDPVEPTVARIVDHIEHIAEVAGIDHVGIGPDFIKEYADERWGRYPDIRFEDVKIGATIPGMLTSSDLPNLTDEMVRRRIDDDHVRKVLGQNYLRVFRDVMGIARA